ncbi:endonuclease [candidate division WWE3 bacterium RIFOXYC1_FULL_40_10]|uniref:Endonuclease n=1 Tax=candidate division WWE3 bacterium RIFOXYA2_FULL_46_9 TaxID=1802636 RepID=A0A1F4VYQ0_UNCKA|nr:MAG: endonuclease [candidate division WWE3 bacterium RIFOXYB1_FULL_40_22]OGC61698.1 MAG: endonuclease [candidate division WWE3 bacterium RIFOXYA1_FULL_40_11]OGC62317.1 MAG: endonuclease [candidate division WWE3 bacterium RIFOXYA2_FULL_46_9]OGC64873.1 MAG: endonuclease [candidate division WWE3 bacterium RIFOXYB2_FULL_41_6]OGC66081.1 MAG: endonuclease [candidate division WWE3 bacterium RIFOXYC1_FULL_40_10]OGC70360.1 MAG: endonuclease [candidate division WWE3 bacterium RIFOXYD1_FULL_40_11]HLD
MYFVYVLKNAKGVLYKGLTRDPLTRLEQHNKSRNRSTKGKGVWELVLIENYNTRAEARKREKYLKSGSGREMLRRILHL